MKIRLAMLADTKQMAIVHKASIEGLCAASYRAEDIAAWVSVISPEIYNSAIAEKVTLVAEENDQILGLGILNIIGREIDAVYIHPSVKGRGVGKAILAELERLALAEGAEAVTLRSTINALGFYEHYGYVQQSRTSHTLPNGAKLECIAMHKTLV